MRRAAIASMLLLAGCDTRAINRLELSSLGLEYGFLVVLDDQDRPTRASKFFGLTPDQKISFGELPFFELQKDEPRAVLVSLDRAAFSALLPGFDASRPEAFEVVLGLPPDAPELVLDILSERGIAETAIPEPAKLFVVEREKSDEVLETRPAGIELETTIRAATRLSVPIDHEYCRIEGASELRRIAGAPLSFQANSGDTAETFFRQMKRLDDQRILLASWSGIFLARTDEPWTYDGGNYLPLQREGLPVFGLGIDPEPEPDGRRRVIVTAANTDVVPRLGAYWIISAGERDLRLVESSTTVQVALGDVAFGSDGRILIGVLAEPKLYDRPAGATEFHVTELESRTPIDNASHVIATGDPELPFVAATHGRVHFWRSSAGVWSNEDFDQPGLLQFEKPRPTTLVAEGRGNSFRLWVGAQYGQIFSHTAANGWERYEVPLPPRAYSCSKTGMPAPTGALPTVETMTVSGDHIFASLTECSPLFVINRDFSCAAVLPRMGLATTSTAGNVHSIDVRDGSIVVSGDHALLLESTW